jgi:hypothetical protein
MPFEPDASGNVGPPQFDGVVAPLRGRRSRGAGKNAHQPQADDLVVSPRLLVEDALDDGGLFGGPGAEVPGGGFQRAVAEQGLDLGGVSTAQA